MHARSPGSALAIGRTRAAIAVATVLLNAATILPADAQFLEAGTTVLAALPGEFAGDQFGWVSQDLGDLDGDGISEFAATSPGYDGGLSDRGRVYVYGGATRTLLFSPITGPLSGGRLGDAVGAVHDVNGDGVRDIIAGAPSNGPGRAYIYSGATGALLRTYTGQVLGDGFGQCCRGIGDINTDGFGDVVIGAPANDANGATAGRAYVYSGAPAQTLLCTLSGVDANDAFGNSCDVIGDVNSDGVPDFAVGAETFGPGSTAGTGRAYVFSGASCVSPPAPPAPLRTLSPSGLAFTFSSLFIDGERDVNADGTPDIYVSDWVVNKAYIFNGATGALIRTHTGDGNGGFGIGRFAGDADDDGWDDIVLCAWFSSAGASQAGKAFVYSGRTGALLKTYTHTIANAHLGFDANPLGDVNGDGRIDYVFTAADDAGFRGTVYVIAGNVQQFSRADIDLDGDVDGNDRAFFANVLLGTSGNATHIKRSDVNRNGVRDGEDTAAFIDAAL